MRPRADAAQAALLRAANAIFTGDGSTVAKPMLVIHELRARDWASITFTGVRHELDVALAGEPADCAAAFAAIAARLPEVEIALAGQFIADVAVAPGGDPAGFTITALIVDD